MRDHLTVLPASETGGLGDIRVRHPPGTFEPSPATRTTVKAIAARAGDLHGTGIDWGCGVGVLSVAAGRVEGVDEVVGLDLAEENVGAARANAELNEVDARLRFLVADSYRPVDEEGQASMDELRGRADFLVANPPASRDGDAFRFRRRVLREGAAFLRDGAPVLVQALSAYGPDRVRALEAFGYVYGGVALASEPAPLDFTGTRMRRFLATYVRAERAGADRYHFLAPEPGAPDLTALQALKVLREGRTPRGRWEVHLFRRAR